MGKNYAIRQKILLKQGRITQELHDARVAQWRLMRMLKKDNVGNDDVSAAAETEPQNVVDAPDIALSVREKQVIGVLTQRRALDLIAPTCDDIAKLARLPYGVVRETVDALLTKGVVKPTSHGRTHQPRYKLLVFGGLGQ